MVAPLIAAGVAAGAQILGSVLGGNAQVKAAKIAAKEQEKNRKSTNALAKWNYGQNQMRLDPYAFNGIRTNNVLTDLLIGPPAAPAGGAISAGPTLEQKAAWIQANSDNGRAAMRKAGGDLAAQVAAGEAAMTGYKGNNYSAWVQEKSSPFTTGSAAGTPNAMSAWDQFRNSSGYQFRLDQGTKAMTLGLAGKGMLDSGAANKALLEYGQEYASGELGKWMAALANQQNLGMGAASALAGVGQNTVNTIAGANQSAADAASNAALVAGNARAGMWNSIGSGVGQIAGAIGSSYRPSGSTGGAAFSMPSWSGSIGSYSGIGPGNPGWGRG